MSILSIDETLTAAEIVAVCLREIHRDLGDAATRYEGGMDRWDIPPNLTKLADRLDDEADNAAAEQLDDTPIILARQAAANLRILAARPTDQAISQRATAEILRSIAVIVARAITLLDPALAVD